MIPPEIKRPRGYCGLTTPATGASVPRRAFPRRAGGRHEGPDAGASPQHPHDRAPRGARASAQDGGVADRRRRPGGDLRGGAGPRAAARRRLAPPRGRPRRPRGDLLLEPPAAHGGLRRRALHGRHPAHAEHPPLRRGPRLHRRSRAGRGRDRGQEPVAGLAEGGGPGERHPPHDRGRRRARPGPRRHAGLRDAGGLRGAGRAGGRGREPGLRDVLHLGHPRASSTATVRTSSTRWRCAWPTPSGSARATW
jgi:hypothetical protein